MFVRDHSRPTFLHRLDIRTKIFGFIGVVTLAFLFPDPGPSLVVAVLISLLVMLVGLPYRKIIRLLTPLVPLFAFILLFTWFRGQWGAGFTFLFRLFTMAMASALVTLTTPLDDFILLLNKLKVPRDLAFVITTAIRFIPAMDQKRLLIIEAQRARGAEIKGKGRLASRLWHYLPVMVPMIINAILMANTFAMAMLNRGYGYSRVMTDLGELTFSRRDYLALFLVGLVTALGIYLRIRLPV